MEAEPPTKGRLVLRDAEVAGLICRITANGCKTFCVYRSINGKPERVTIGRFPTITVEMARKLAQIINGTIAQGANPAEIKRAHKAESTLQHLFDEYLAKHAKAKKRTWAADEKTYNLYFKKPLGKKRLSEIVRSDIASIHVGITRQLKDPQNPIKYKSGMTANRVLALASSIFGWGINMGICDVNPAKGIKKYPEQSRDRFLQADELPKFFKALHQEKNETVRDFLLIALLTGARRSNALSMSWNQISFERKEWSIPHTKNGDPQVIALSDEAIQILKQRKDNNSDFVFPGDGKTGHLAEPKKVWQNIIDRAGIENLRIHDLRRTLGSWQAKTGASLVIIGKSLGHKSPQATAVYARLDIEPVRKSIETATNAIFKAAGIDKLPNQFSENNLQ